ncbi:GNAT family N-acetyltransferase [Solimonas terrae]|uniref:dATP pyrophosphohydrolase n=1 Tax=Solimonas terrae TaxID=1396819 RepID=A0A6M2BN36_9GAMM|nr:dATP pyrophosphohydrolase [Solimonas terrae]NGY03641.1 dATP pyrophosphohydrolase [Solimonas terrae]
MTSSVEMVPVRSAAEMRRFIRVQARLHAHDPLFIAPLELERSEAFSAKKNPFFAHADVQFWIAQRDGVDVGRISAQIDHLSPMLRDEGAGHFGLIEAEDDPAIFAALFETAEAWLRERGCRRALGPFNLSINEETGLLVRGFDTPPMLMMGHDQPHVGTRIEAQGYEGVKDLLAYILETAHAPPAGLQRMLAQPPKNLRVRPLDKKRYREDIGTITAIFNDAWSQNWGFVPYTEAEVEHLAQALKPLLDPQLVPIAELDGEAVAFGVLLPNLNEAIRDFGGKLLPFNWARLLWRLKVRGVGTGRVPLMGVRRSLGADFTARAVPFFVIDAMRQRCLQLGIRQVELSWILENNAPMRRLLEMIGSRDYKTYRVYGKAL